MDEFLQKMAGNGHEEFSFTNGVVARNGLAKIQTQKKENGVCHDDSAAPVKAQTIDELHSLQKKKSAPTTPIKGTQGAFTISDEERQKQQLQSIRYTRKPSTSASGPTVWAFHSGGYCCRGRFGCYHVL